MPLKNHFYVISWEDDGIRNDMVIDSFGTIYFKAYDLTYQSEDATLNRCMFNGEDYIKALDMGAKLAQTYYGMDVEYLNFDSKNDAWAFVDKMQEE